MFQERIFSGKVLVPCVAIILVLLWAATSRGLINPHVEPANCESCHVKIPSQEEAERGDYFLLKETIDSTCHICHEYTCCKVGSLHEKERNHPSNIDRWDRNKVAEPKTLPLFDGYITCSTCHYHRKPEGGDYKMIRILKKNVLGDLRNWEGLCVDCHIKL